MELHGVYRAFFRRNRPPGYYGKMRRGSLIAFVLVGMFSRCGGEEASTSKDREGEAGKVVKDIDRDTLEEHLPDTLVDLTAVPVDSGIIFKTLSFVDQVNGLYEQVEPKGSDLIERFKASFKQKVRLRSRYPVLVDSQHVFPQYQFVVISYPDSAAFSNVISNWFNCFGGKCDQIIPGKREMVDSDPLFVVLNPELYQIIQAKAECFEETLVWGQMKKWMIQLYGHEGWFGFEVNCSGNLKWIGKVPD